MNHVIKTAVDAAAASTGVSAIFAGIGLYTARERARRANSDPFVKRINDLLGPGTCKTFLPTRRVMWRARRELKTITPAMFTTKEHSSDDC